MTIINEFIPFNFTSYDNGKMVGDLNATLMAATHDKQWGDILYLYMLVRRNGMMRDMSLKFNFYSQGVRLFIR